MRLRETVLLACSLVAGGSAIIACSDEDALGSSDSSNAAITLENGERYLDRIEGNRVILHRKVNGRDLPFTDEEFTGKNIVIHPTSLKADDGIMARVVSVEPGVKDVTLIVRPLELDEFAQAAKNGDDTLTIYRNSSLRALPGALGARSTTSSPGYGSGIGTQSLGFPSGLRIQANESGLSTEWPPSITAATGFSDFVGYVNVKVEDNQFNFNPDLSGKWIEGRGLQLGARLDVSHKLTLAFSGAAMANAPVFEKVGEENLMVIGKAGPIDLFQAPVTIGGIYSTVGLKAMIACYARAEQKFSGKLTVDLGASIGGSMVVQTEGDSSSWIAEGDQPFAATGHASASLDAELGAFTPSIFCELPKVTIYVQPGGKIAEKLGGPQIYAAGAGRYSASWDSDPGFKVNVMAGVTASPLGRSMTFETTLLTWRP